MKKIYISVALLAAAYAQAQVGFGTSTPHKSAQIDIDSNNKGLLMPRVELVSLTNGVTPINAPADGLLVYNTKVDTTEKLEKGFYVWEGTTWKRFATQNELEAVSYWKAQAASTSGGNMPAPPNGSGAFNVQTFNNTVEPVDVDIFQVGRVGIGLGNFDNITTPKQLEVAGDFRTIDFNATTNHYYGLETNSGVFDEQPLVGNILFSSKARNITGINEEKSNDADGTILYQENNNTHIVSRSGKTSSQSSRINVFHQRPKETVMQLYDFTTTNSKNGAYFYMSPEQGFSVTNTKDASNNSNFSGLFSKVDNPLQIWIGRGNTTDYIDFPKTAGKKNQVLFVSTYNQDVATGGGATYYGNTAVLDWKNPLDILTPGSANQVLVTNPSGTGVTWVDQSTIVPTTTVSNALSGSNLTTTVNGVAATPLDLGPMIQAAQKTSSVVDGVTTTVSTPVTTGNNTAYTVEVKDGAITTEKLADNAVTSDKILDGTIATVDLANKAITTDKLADDAVTPAKIDTTGAQPGQTLVVNTDGSISYQNISAANVVGENLTAADGATATIEVASGGTAAVLVPTSLRVKAESITSAQIKDGTITGADIASETITGANIADKTITNDKLDAGSAAAGTVATSNGDGTVTYQTLTQAAGQDLTTDGKIVIGDNTSTITTQTDAVLVATRLAIKAGSIGSNEITDGSITGADIASKTITSDKLDAGTGNAGKVPVANADGTVMYQNISAANVVGEDLTAGDGSITVTNGTGATLVDANVKVATGGISTDKLANGAVTSDKIATDAITTDKIAAGAVESSDIKAGAVTNDKLTAGTGTNNRVGIADATGNVTYTDLNTLVQGAQKFETVSVGNGITLTPTTNGNTTDFNVKLTPGSTGQVLTTQTGTSGIETQWKNLEDLGISSTPKFFYMPSVVLPTIPTDSRITASGNYTVAAGVFTVKLYELFKGQFTSPVKSSSATSTLDEFVKVATGYDYFVTYADEAVFTDITLDANGVLTYKVNPNAIIKTGSFMNIVLKVK